MHHHTQLIFVFLVKMGFHHVGQAGLEFLTLGDLPASASQGARITGMSHHAQPLALLKNNVKIYFANVTKRQDNTMLPRLVSNFWAPAIFSPQHPEKWVFAMLPRLSQTLGLKRSAHLSLPKFWDYSPIDTDDFRQDGQIERVLEHSSQQERRRDTALPPSPLQPTDQEIPAKSTASYQHKSEQQLQQASQVVNTNLDRRSD
ncbi:hypothetical protein AAY473_022527 [Plecturocebus cupreus]